MHADNNILWKRENNCFSYQWCYTYNTIQTYDFDTNKLLSFNNNNNSYMKISQQFCSVMKNTYTKIIAYDSNNK